MIHYNQYNGGQLKYQPACGKNSTDCIGLEKLLNIYLVYWIYIWFIEYIFDLLNIYLVSYGIYIWFIEYIFGQLWNLYLDLLNK